MDDADRNATMLATVVRSWRRGLDAAAMNDAQYAVRARDDFIAVRGHDECRAASAATRAQ